MMISSSLPKPTVCGRPHVVADDIQKSYDDTDALIPTLQTMMSSDPNAAAALKQMAAEARAKFKESVLSINALPATAEEARKTALIALQAGLLAGALDGVITFAAASAPAPTPGPAPAPPTGSAGSKSDVGDDIKADLEKLMQDLSKAAAQAAEKLEKVGPDVMRALSHGQKRVAAATVEQSQLFVGQKDTPVQAYQGYLAASFAMGYGIAVNDAAITVLANQKP